MVRRLLKIFHKEFGGLHEAAYLLAIFALLSQVLGLVRDRLLAHSFGASHALDMYYAAFRIPDFLFVSIASFASATAIVPFFIERIGKGHDEAKKFLHDNFTLFIVAMATASLFVFVLMPFLAPYVVPGFSSADQTQVVFLARVLLLSPFLLGLSNLVGSITQSVNKFFVFALSPVLYNLGIIIGIIFLYPMFGLLGIILGVVMGAFGVSYSVAAFPTMARLCANGEKKKFAAQITNAAKHIIFWSLPVIFLFIVLRAQIVRVVLGSGRFSWNDTRLTAAALALFTISLIAQSLILLFTRGYYATGNTKKPLVMNFFCAVLIIILAFFFIHVFAGQNDFRIFMESVLKIKGVEGAGVIALPLAYSIGTILNAVMHWVAFEREFAKGMTKEISQAFWHSLTASFAMGFVAYEGLNVFALIFDQNKFLGVFFQGFLSGILGIAAGVVVLILLKNPEFETVRVELHHKFWKAKPVSPGQEEI
ncbi:MAG: MATE family efflux transporter [Candidatus Parcubacteria bacterium]|nr:MATE family efflux transporter [Candidatus Parcubacteria bacterium]